MGLKFQAAIVTDLPVQELARIFGPIDRQGDVFVTRVFRSPEHLKTLVGTAQSRAERYGLPEFGAHIIPAGTKPSTDKKKFVVKGPLKCRLDYGRREDPKYYEGVPQPSSFYDRRAAEPKHPETIVIPANEHYPDGLKEIDVYAYYQKVAPEIIQQYAEFGLDGMVLMQTDGIIVRRHAAYEILAMQINNAVFARLNQGRTVEFHFAVGDTTRLVWFDLDPKAEFPWNDTKKAALDLELKLRNDELFGDIIDTKIRFSGKSGFHVVGVTKNPIDTKHAYEIMKAIAEEYIAEMKDDRLTTGVTKEPNSMRIDMSTLHRAGGLRADYSLAYPTGLICLPLERDEVLAFEKSQASVDNVLERSAAATNVDPAKYDLLPEHIAAMDKWLNEGGVDTGEEIRLILYAYEHMSTDQFIELVREVKGMLGAVDEDKVVTMIRGLQGLATMPKYQASNGNGNGNGHGENGHRPGMPRLLVPLEDIAEKTQPEIEQLPKEAVSFLLTLPGKVSPTEIRRYIKTILGFEVPLEQVGEFISRLKLMVAETTTAQAEESWSQEADLSQYRQKRRFDVTEEPTGDLQKDTAENFVVQKHEAHTAGLHFDFRLARYGVLHSWAVPKLMDLISGNKDTVLAIHTEPHPLEYAGFEGEIPEGEYGAGRVRVWDEGTYKLDSLSDRAWKFTLQGSRLKGSFVLFQGAGDRWFLKRAKEAEDVVD